jgi:GxxExxY protein
MDADKITEAIIGACFEVSKVLGAGFLEKIYERALRRELELRGLRVRSQVGYRVSYKGLFIGEYVADLLVEDGVLVELKCVERLANEHMAQCINYLKASGLRLALLVKFQKPKVEWRRVVYGPQMDTVGHG